MIKKILRPVPPYLQRTRLRIPILKRLFLLDNFLHRWISFFSFEEGVHVKHRITKYHHFFLNNVSSNDTVLDIGCGQGQLSYDLAKSAKRVVGIDINKESIAYAKNNFTSPNLTFIKNDIASYHFQKTFDIIVLSNVLEHIKDRTIFLNKIRNTAKTLLIRVPMIDRDWITLLKKELGIEYRLDPTHYTEYTEEQFRNEVENASLQIKSLSIRFGEIYCVLVHD